MEAASSFRKSLRTVQDLFRRNTEFLFIHINVPGKNSLHVCSLFVESEILQMKGRTTLFIFLVHLMSCGIQSRSLAIRLTTS